MTPLLPLSKPPASKSNAASQFWRKSLDKYLLSHLAPRSRYGHWVSSQSISKWSLTLCSVWGSLQRSVLRCWTCWEKKIRKRSWVCREYAICSWGRRACLQAYLSYEEAWKRTTSIKQIKRAIIIGLLRSWQWNAPPCNCRPPILIRATGRLYCIWRGRCTD